MNIPLAPDFTDGDARYSIHRGKSDLVLDLSSALPPLVIHLLWGELNRENTSYHPYLLAESLYADL